VHWLVVVPFYFFAALTAFLALTLLGRVLRLKSGASSLATLAVLLAILALAVPLTANWIDVADLSGRRLLALGAASFVLAALDTVLQSVLPLPLDDELSAF
jgi:hypothetical protein